MYKYVLLLFLKSREDKYKNHIYTFFFYNNKLFFYVLKRFFKDARVGAFYRMLVHSISLQHFTLKKHYLIYNPLSFRS